MAHKQGGGLLAQIEADVVDDTVPLSSLLQKCIVLGGQAGSEKMRAWARRELNGYAGADTVPDYRHIPTAVMAVITNRAGYNRITQRIHDSVFPQQIRDIIRRDVQAMHVDGVRQLADVSDEELIATDHSIPSARNQMEMQRRLKVAIEALTAETVLGRKAANRAAVMIVALTAVLVALTVVLADDREAAR